MRALMISDNRHPELPARGDEDGLRAERVPQEADGGGAREEQQAPDQPYHQLSVPPSEQRVFNRCHGRRKHLTRFALERVIRIPPYLS